MDFGADARLPDSQQVALDCYYGFLYNPYVACEAAETFRDSEEPDRKLWAFGFVLHASLLHPIHLDIHHALAVPFSASYTRYVYCLGRLFAHAVAGCRRSDVNFTEEISALKERAKPFNAEVYDAFGANDYKSLSRLKTYKLKNSEQMYDFAWWSRFFPTYARQVQMCRRFLSLRSN